MTKAYNDTIAAIATATMPSGIGIVRLSGPDAIRIADQCFRGKTSLKDSKSHTIHYGYIYQDDIKIDEVLISVFLAPSSYTTEDVVEINCHGGVYLLERILNIVLAKGARLADPGEFTKRAFLGGRIDLSEAEAVMKLISSENEYARRSAINQLSGVLSRDIVNMRDQILEGLAHIEAALDDPEHIELDFVDREYADNLRNICNRLDKMLSSSAAGALLSEGIPTVIIGKPNVGKSSIWNRMVGRDLAIVTDIPGTTRDVLNETVRIGDISLRLSDTAGIRKTDDPVESIGVDKALSYVDMAALVLVVIDGSKPLDTNDFKILEAAVDKNAIILLNKSDLEAVVAAEDIINKITYEPPIIDISAMDGSGMDELYRIISSMFVSGDIGERESQITISERHSELLRSARGSLGLALQGIESGVSEDLLTVDLMDAYKSLGLIIGSEISDDLVDKIFSDFCMGK